MKIFLLTLEVLVCVLLVGSILLQPSDASLGNVRSGDFLAGRSAAHFLARVTAVLTVIFFLLCLTLGILSHRDTKSSPVDKLPISSKAQSVSIPKDMKL